MSSKKIIFAGTPIFGLASLSALVDSGYRPDLVLTQPDRPAGRGKKIRSSPVKNFACENNIRVFQPEVLESEIAEKIRILRPDIFIVVAYGLIIPASILEIPRFGCINVHPSLLPNWRGASPMQHAILSQDSQTGVSLMQMNEGLDSGPIYAQEIINLGHEETAGELHDRLSLIGAEMLVKTLPEIFSGDLIPTPQNHENASYATKIFRENAKINWKNSAKEINIKIRAFNPVPTAWFDFNDEAIKCWKASVLDSFCDEPGKFRVTENFNIQVQCGSGSLVLDEVQRPGRSRISSREFAQQIRKFLFS